MSSTGISLINAGQEEDLIKKSSSKCLVIVLQDVVKPLPYDQLVRERRAAVDKSLICLGIKEKVTEN